MGIITAEIGLGLRYIALVHIIGHACLRTLQLVRAPTLLHDYHRLENAIGSHLPEHRQSANEFARLRFYRLALGRGYLDSLINEFFVRPFVFLFRGCDDIERKWTRLIGGTYQRSDQIRPGAAAERSSFE